MAVFKKKFSEVSDILGEKNIFFKNTKSDRHAPEDVLEFSGDLSLEPYSAILAGNLLFSVGSFSYTWSALPLNTVVGRYCSITRGVRVMGVRHPL